MKNICLLLLFFPILVFAQNGKSLYPESQYIYSDKGYSEHIQNWARCIKIWNGDAAKMTKDDAAFCAINCDETMSSYWQTESDGCSWYCGGGPNKVTGSSTLSTNNNTNYDASKAHDAMVNTAWVEGVSGNGIGEYLEYTFSRFSPRITTVKIAGGYLKSDKAYQENARAKTINMLVNEELHSVFHLADIRALQFFNVDTLFNVRNVKDTSLLPQKWVVKFVIADVYKGSKYEDLAISEISFDGLDVHCFAKGTNITLANNSEIAIENLKTSDKILSYNVVTGKFFTDSIVELAEQIHYNLITITFTDGSVITSTQDHPYYNIENKWLSYSPNSTHAKYKYSRVEKLKIGSILKTQYGEKEIAAITEEEASQLTYTIVKLAYGNTFIANGIIVGTEELK